MSRTRSSLALLAGCVWALGLGGTAALAADMAMPVKAPPPPPPPPSLWSAFVEVNYEFGQVNPQGQAVYKNGDYNVIAGANLNLYSDKAGFINSFTIGGLGIVDFASSSTLGPSDSFWANNNPTQGGSTLYYILAADASVGFWQYWTLADTFFHLNGANTSGAESNVGNGSTGLGVLSTPGLVNPNCRWTANVPGATLGCLDLPAWYWNELKLSLNDGAITHWPLSFNPYVIVYTELYPSGLAGWLTTTTSAACFSCNSQGTDVIIGMVPKLSLQPYFGVPITLTAPTWITVGPQSFWNFNGAALTNTGSSSGDVGVFSTGLTAALAMTWIPSQYGHWNLKAGFQWYDIVNTELQHDNMVTYGNSFGLQQSIFTGFVGVGVGF